MSRGLSIAEYVRKNMADEFGGRVYAQTQDLVISTMRKPLATVDFVTAVEEPWVIGDATRRVNAQYQVTVWDTDHVGMRKRLSHLERLLRSAYTDGIPGIPLVGRADDLLNAGDNKTYYSRQTPWMIPPQGLEQSTMDVAPESQTPPWTKVVVGTATGGVSGGMLAMSAPNSGDEIRYSKVPLGGLLLGWWGRLIPPQGDETNPFQVILTRLGAGIRVEIGSDIRAQDLAGNPLEVVAYPTDRLGFHELAVLLLTPGGGQPNEYVVQWDGRTVLRRPVADTTPIAGLVRFALVSGTDAVTATVDEVRVWREDVEGVPEPVVIRRGVGEGAVVVTTGFSIDQANGLIRFAAAQPATDRITADYKAGVVDFSLGGSRNVAMTDLQNKLHKYNGVLTLDTWFSTVGTVRRIA